MTTNTTLEMSPAEATAYNLRNILSMPDHNLAFEALHHNGTLRDELTLDEQTEARKRADGYGAYNPTHATLNGQPVDNLGWKLWDWSHVRDSSDDAFRRMGLYIRQCLRDHYASRVQQEAEELRRKSDAAYKICREMRRMAV